MAAEKTLKLLEVRCNIVILATLVLGNICEMIKWIMPTKHEEIINVWTGVFLIIVWGFMISDNKISNMLIEHFKDGRAFQLCGVLSILACILNYWDSITGELGRILAVYLTLIAIIICVNPRHTDCMLAVTLKVGTFILALMTFSVAGSFLLISC